MVFPQAFFGQLPARYRNVHGFERLTVGHHYLYNIFVIGSKIPSGDFPALVDTCYRCFSATACGPNGIHIESWMDMLHKFIINPLRMVCCALLLFNNKEKSTFSQIAPTVTEHHPPFFRSPVSNKTFCVTGARQHDRLPFRRTSVGHAMSGSGGCRRMMMCAGVVELPRARRRACRSIYFRYPPQNRAINWIESSPDRRRKMRSADNMSFTAACERRVGTSVI